MLINGELNEDHGRKRECVLAHPLRNFIVKILLSFDPSLQFGETFLKLDIHPDLPLTFAYMPQNILIIQKRLEQQFGIQQPLKYRLRQQALMALIAETVMAARMQRRLSYSCQNNWYTGKDFYYGKHFTRSHILGAIKDVQHANIFDIIKAKPGDHWHTGLQSTITATPALVACYGNMPTDQVQQRPLRMKDRDLEDGESRLISYKDTGFTLAKTAKLKQINGFLWSVHVDFPAQFLRQNDQVLVEGEWIWPRRVQLHSVHTRNSWNCHGRMYGWHTSLRKVVRGHIRLDGDQTVEIDYSACHPHMLFAMQRLQLDRDVYDHGMFFPRDTWKTVFNISVNAKFLKIAVGAIARELREDENMARFYINMTNYFIPELMSYMHSDIGITLQRKDSDIMLEVMLQLTGEKIPALPVHDSVIVPEKHMVRVDQIMKATYTRFFPGFEINTKVS